ncbi:hypothetical protein IWW55_003106 [Coemansia sp. RSA 2706]|nr:hypothetical protein LPJ70_000898 [Coemansia sp. RSA 2708]KAJ2303080.1 hypothetical protein IWW55_003106 [Coemansia sp. RSA 2706]KAJ2317408.1 hypothetical protein IWW52_003144 [Coemansia sp. RSA 2704]KAJ2361062.1 hypothetical protein H4S01_005438 [Coemansia sp. RSA 2610]KAJ2375267.1 hypothetical protein H4S02_008281 [Coemansia sp. RSA 2611]KAJ2727520.1 hypothetical protein H4R23_003864 [Coemansia sp. Cherry 401B]
MDPSGMDLDSPSQRPEMSRAQLAPSTPPPSKDNTPLASRQYSEMSGAASNQVDYEYDDEYMPGYGHPDAPRLSALPGDIDETNKLVDEDVFNQFTDSWAILE